MLAWYGLGGKPNHSKNRSSNDSSNATNIPPPSNGMKRSSTEDLQAVKLASTAVAISSHRPSHIRHQQANSNLFHTNATQAGTTSGSAALQHPHSTPHAQWSQMQKNEEWRQGSAQQPLLSVSISVFTPSRNDSNEEIVHIRMDPILQNTHGRALPFNNNNYKALQPKPTRNTSTLHIPQPFQPIRHHKQPSMQVHHSHQHHSYSPAQLRQSPSDASMLILDSSSSPPLLDADGDANVDAKSGFAASPSPSSVAHSTARSSTTETNEQAVPVSAFLAGSDDENENESEDASVSDDASNSDEIGNEIGGMAGASPSSSNDDGSSERDPSMSEGGVDWPAADQDIVAPLGVATADHANHTQQFHPHRKVDASEARIGMASRAYTSALSSESRSQSRSPLSPLSCHSQQTSTATYTTLKDDDVMLCISPPSVRNRSTIDSSMPHRASLPAATTIQLPQPPQRQQPSNATQKYATLGGKSNPRTSLNAKDPTHQASHPTHSTSTISSSNKVVEPLQLSDSLLFHSMLTKQVRSEYLNRELNLITNLHDLSTLLLRTSVGERTRVLREQLRALDSDQHGARGLYFPLVPHGMTGGTSAASPRETKSGSHARCLGLMNGGCHYRILRLLPDDCSPLNSRDKAPFLLFAEVRFEFRHATNSHNSDAHHLRPMSSYDGDIYTAFKSNEQIMREALMMVSPTPTHPPTPSLKSTPHTDHEAETDSSKVSDAVAASEAQRGTKLAALMSAAEGKRMEDGSIPHSPNTSRNAQSNQETQFEPLSHAPTAPTSTSSSACSASTVAASTVTTISQPPASSGSVHVDGAKCVDSAPLPSPSSTSVSTIQFHPPTQPFRPRRCAAYPTGPTLCDVDFIVLDRAFGESFAAKRRRIQRNSPFMHLEDGGEKNQSAKASHQWGLVSVIFKAGDDLRQEILAMQLIDAFDRVFRAAKLPLSLRPYSVVLTSPDSGLIETIPDAVSVDSLKKRLQPKFTCLADFFAAYFGGAELLRLVESEERVEEILPSGIVSYQVALRNYVESLAAYSIVTYLLAIKDRHNGNILIDRSGRIIHIDFGFMLANSPGGNWGWETSPFKLTQEYIDVMGGTRSDLFAYFRMLFLRGFLEARAHVDEFIALAAVHAQHSCMPCFNAAAAGAVGTVNVNVVNNVNGDGVSVAGSVGTSGGSAALAAMRSRFALHLSRECDLEKFVNGLIDESIDNWRSRKYDRFQWIVSGIM